MKLKVGDRIKIDEGVDYGFTVGTITEFLKRKDKGNNTVLALLIEESNIHMVNNKIIFWIVPEEVSKIEVIN